MKLRVGQHIKIMDIMEGIVTDYDGSSVEIKSKDGVKRYSTSGPHRVIHILDDPEPDEGSVVFHKGTGLPAFRGPTGWLIAGSDKPMGWGQIKDDYERRGK